MYVSNGYDLCYVILFTIILTLAPLICAIMVDYYVVKPQCQMFFEGYQPPGYWEETQSLYVSRIIYC
jgi:cytosine/uracil/thiamine/allantoin permease